MTSVDWIIVAFAALLALGGARRGFVVGALSLVGFVAGAFAGTRIAPALLPQGSASPWAPAFGLLGALIAGGILATGLEGIGIRLRRGLRLTGLGPFDGVLGALFSAAVGLGIVWIVAAVLMQEPGAGAGLRGDLQRSAILRRLDAVLPPTSTVLNALARLDPLPSISGPSPDVAPPAPAIAHSRAVRDAAPSVVRIVGSACGVGIEGSGWVAAPGVVVTNAHVIAGEHDTMVQPHGDSAVSLGAYPIAFDPHDDIAVLRVPGLRAPALSLAASEPSAGTSAAILGYPENGPFDAEPGRLGSTQQIITQDAYGNGPVRRLITPIRGLVRPGNSGGPMVDSAGHVMTTVFAATTGSGPRGGYGVADATVRQVLASARGPVSSGACAE